MNNAGLMPVFVCIAFLILANSCGETTTLHPDKNRLPGDDKVDYRIDFNKSYPAPIEQFLKPVEWSFKTTISDSLLNDYYGLLMHLAKMDIDPSGNIYIQYQNTTIKVYDSTGTYSYSIGKSGRGPGELFKLYSFDFSQDYKKLYLLGAFKVEVFSLIDGVYEYDTSFVHKFMSPRSICVLGNHLYIGGFLYSDAGLENESETNRIASYPIHKMHIDSFELARSFGFEYRAYNDLPQFNKFMSETILTCNHSSNTVIGQLKDFPYMFGYTPDGKIKWISKFDNYLSTEFTETIKPSLSLIPSNQEVYNRLYPFRKIHGSGYELIQAGYQMPYWYLLALSRNENPEPIEIDQPLFRTILVDSENGELHMSDAYGLIGAVRDNKMVIIDFLDRDQLINKVLLYEK